MLQWICFLWLLSLVAGEEQLTGTDRQPIPQLDCAQHKNIPYCSWKHKALGAKSFSTDDRIIDEKEKFRRAAADRAACIELREEYINACAMISRHKIVGSTQEFCEAYETVCFEIPEGEPDQPTLPTTRPPATYETPKPEREHKPKDYTAACRYYKQRYLYVCPDPLRYGQKAVIFCPLYAEKCHVPLPGKPVVPNTERQSGRTVLSTIRHLCAQYRQTANVFCGNLAAIRPEAREACERYRRFCL